MFNSLQSFSALLRPKWNSIKAFQDFRLGISEVYVRISLFSTYLLYKFQVLQIVALRFFVFGADVRTNVRTPYVKLMTTYWPGPGGSKVLVHYYHLTNN